jgi:hypothetical protein
MDGGGVGGIMDICIGKCIGTISGGIGSDDCTTGKNIGEL